MKFYKTDSYKEAAQMAAEDVKNGMKGSVVNLD